MARIKGITGFSGNFEPQSSAPLDARMYCETQADLTNPDTWEALDGNVYTYKGMMVAVYGDTDDNNGIYILVNDDYTDINNWKRIGNGLWIQRPRSDGYGDELIPKDSAVKRIGIYNNEEGFTDFFLRNSNTTSTYSGVSISMTVSDIDYQNQTFIAHFGPNYWDSKFKNNGAMLSTGSLRVGSYGGGILAISLGNTWSSMIDRVIYNNTSRQTDYKDLGYYELFDYSALNKKEYFNKDTNLLYYKETYVSRGTYDSPSDLQLDDVVYLDIIYGRYGGNYVNASIDKVFLTQIGGVDKWVRRWAVGFDTNHLTMAGGGHIGINSLPDPNYQIRAVASDTASGFYFNGTFNVRSDTGVSAGWHWLASFYDREPGSGTVGFAALYYADGVNKLYTVLYGAGGKDFGITTYEGGSWGSYPAIYIKDGGNVQDTKIGINTRTPAYKLDVMGNGRFLGDLRLFYDDTLSRNAGLYMHSKNPLFFVYPNGSPATFYFEYFDNTGSTTQSNLDMEKRKYYMYDENQYIHREVARINIGVNDVSSNGNSSWFGEGRYEIYLASGYTGSLNNMLYLDGSGNVALGYGVNAVMSLIASVYAKNNLTVSGDLNVYGNKNVSIPKIDEDTGELKYFIKARAVESPYENWFIYRKRIKVIDTVYTLELPDDFMYVSMVDNDNIVVSINGVDNFGRGKWSVDKNIILLEFTEAGTYDVVIMARRKDTFVRDEMVKELRGYK